MIITTKTVDILYGGCHAGTGHACWPQSSNWSARVGICVALFDDYGPAQRLYATRGYIPDGRGACHRFTPLRRGDVITLDDDHLLDFLRHAAWYAD